MTYDFKEDDRWNQVSENVCPECGEKELYKYWTPIAYLPNVLICENCENEWRERPTG